MAKLTVVSALLVAALLAVAAEASFRTTISTIVDEESQWGGRGQKPQRCQQQIQQWKQQLLQCEPMLSGSRSDMDMEMTSQYGQQQKEQQQRQCCQGLESLDRRCRCEAVNQMVKDMMMQGQGQSRQASQHQSEMMEKARYLPNMCNLEPRQCQISTTVDEESQLGGRGEQPQRCEQQIQQWKQQLLQCEPMLSGCRSDMDMQMMSQYGQQQKEQQQRQCCQGLESLDRGCRCDAVNQMVQDMMKQGQEQGQSRQASRHQSEMMEKMMEKARYLPNMCKLEPRQCQIQSPYF